MDLPALNFDMTTASPLVLNYLLGIYSVCTGICFESIFKSIATVIEETVSAVIIFVIIVQTTMLRIQRIAYKCPKHICKNYKNYLFNAPLIELFQRVLFLLGPCQHFGWGLYCFCPFLDI